ncbi:hypothetical protein BDV12DRAFT_188990 [Aspergillus spectabilis]
MYKTEVPLYGDLMQIVQSVNSQRESSESPERLSLERHGAIRLGTAEELRTMRRVFALVGMYPVGYYDLSIAGLPMHATCFRPVDNTALTQNPFRVFTTVLRPELLKSAAARVTALSLLEQRKIFSEELLELLDIADGQHNRLTQHQAENFIKEAMLTFGWRSTAAATRAGYEQLKSEHPILADIACFKSAHINHLTPRRRQCVPQGWRKCPILLRQTSFLALEEKIHFRVDNTSLEDEWTEGSHKARFGEIEQRGAALLEKAMMGVIIPQANVDEIMDRTFKTYPDSWTELRRQGLVYFEYRCTGKPTTLSEADFANMLEAPSLERLITEGVLEAVPITYEDFLPLSAAGIFQSNLQSNGIPLRSVVNEESQPQADQEGFERALGCPVMDADELYASAQKEGLGISVAKLNLRRL